MSDGAAAVLIAKRSAAIRLGLPIKGRILSYFASGCPPELNGIGPIYAIPKALEKCGLTVNDVDVWEFNEAFAS